MKKLGFLLAIAVVFAVMFTFTKQAQNSTPDKMQVKPIPELEAERLAKQPIDRTDTGRLTKETLVKETEIVTTRSSFYVLEQVEASSVTLPVTSEKAKIAVLSETDASLDVAITDPNGSDLKVNPYSKNESISDNEMSKLVNGRGRKGVMFINEKQKMLPGNYLLNVKQGSGTIDILVNDEGGPVMTVWTSENGVDKDQPITVYARLSDDAGYVTGAQLKIKIKGDKGKKRVQMFESEPGLYSAKVNTSKLDTITTFIVEANGHTKSGLQLARTGSIEVISGKSNARLLGVVKEELTATDLNVEVSVEVSATGRYYLKGNLLTSNGEPIAWAQDAKELSPGSHILTLHFAKELINQSGEKAGFKLSDVELMNTTEMPGIKAKGKIRDYFLSSSL
ncbi:MAG: hypothetical protein JNN15_02110 [Blastocatellia bacterium]|nr:hypothetical protein [Blastocatellia bacterium]